MINIFNLPFAGGRTPVVLPMYDYIISRMKEQHNRVKSFYRENVFAVDNSHILVKVLTEMNRYMELTPDQVVHQVEANTSALERAFSFNSPVVDGGYRNDGSLYNRHVPEVWISVDHDFDVDRCVANWRELQPIRCLNHEFTDLTMGIPNGKYINDNNAIVVVAVDLPMLALQYKCWTDEVRFNPETGLYRPLHEFIYQYPLTALTATQTDIAIFNRLHNTLKGVKNNTSRDRHSFLVVDYALRIDDLNERLLDTFKRRPLDWKAILNSIPSITYGSYYRSTSYPDMAATRQVKWALVMARLKMVEFLLDLDDITKTNAAINLEMRDIISRELRATLSDKSMQLFPSAEITKRINSVYARVNRETP